MMNKEDKEALTVLGGGALLVSFLPVMRDPYFHIEHVNFWEWLIREINEALYGERARLELMKARLPEWYSFEPLLRKYLRLKQPQRILEWGTGVSTRIMIDELPDAQIYTIEHDSRWAREWRKEFAHYQNVHIYEIPLTEGYASRPLDWGKFDMVFIDGANPREDLMSVAADVVAEDGYVILHDSDAYYINPHLFKIIEKDNTTTVMQKWIG